MGRGWRGPESSLSEAGGECVRMVPRFHPATVDCVPGSAGRAAASTSHVSELLFFHVIYLHILLLTLVCACVCASMSVCVR